MSLLTATVAFICRQCGAKVETTLPKLTEADKQRLCSKCA